MQQKINSAPTAALKQLEAVLSSSSQSTCFTFFSCCCATDDEERSNLDPLSQEGRKSLALLITDLRRLIIPLEQFNLYSKNRSTVEQTISVQRSKTVAILEQAINKKKYPDLSESIISVLTDVLGSFPKQDGLRSGVEEDESLDSHHRDDKSLLSKFTK